MRCGFAGTVHPALYSIRHILLRICVFCQGLSVPKSIGVKTDFEGIGRRIRILRANMLQEAFAKYLGISQGQLSKIERGKLGPTVEILIRLVKRFGKTADWILTGQD